MLVNKNNQTGPIRCWRFLNMTGEKTMKNYKGAIFDLDGTLLDTLQDLADSVNEVLTFYGFPNHDKEEYKLKVGKGFRNLLEVSLPQNTDKELDMEVVLHKFVEIYDKNYRNKTVPYPGIVSLLHNLNNKGIKIAVNSNKRTDYTEALIHQFFGDIPFVEIFGERQGIPKKPDPAAALEIAEKMQLQPEEILYIGDSKTDMQTGKNAKMGKAGVLWGFRGAKELQENGADYLIKDAEELEKLF